MAARPTLYDAYNRPIDWSVLREELAAPALGTIRTVWTTTVASGLTPQRLASLLQAAVEGEHYDYLTLAEEIEERDLHYASVLRTRKLAVAGLPVMVEAASDSAQDKKLADAVRELARGADFAEMLADLLDALGKGYSVEEILWDSSASQWQPRYAWRDPRWFVFDFATRSELLLRDATAPLGLPLAPYKFIQHRPRLKTGLPIRGGLARLAVWAYLFKAYSVKDWAAFAEVYGIPMRVGRYGSGATDEDRRQLLSAVVNLGADAAAIIHESMRIEFQNAVEGSGNNDLFEKIADWWDRQTSKAVLGQTATTEGTPGKLGNEQSQDKVRQDLIVADAQQLSATLNRDLVRPFIDLNFGPQASYPRLQLQVIEAEDIAALVEALDKLVPLGLKVEQSVVRDKLGLPDPPEGAELLTPLAAPLQLPAQNRALRRALNAALPDGGTGEPELDGLEAQGLDGWEEVMAPVLDPLRKLVEEAASYEDLTAGLAALFPDMDVQSLTIALAKAFFLARAAGNGDPQS